MKNQKNCPDKCTEFAIFSAYYCLDKCSELPTGKVLKMLQVIDIITYKKVLKMLLLFDKNAYCKSIEVLMMMNPHHPDSRWAAQLLRSKCALNVPLRARPCSAPPCPHCSACAPATPPASES